MWTWRMSSCCRYRMLPKHTALPPSWTKQIVGSLPCTTACGDDGDTSIPIWNDSMLVGN
ncbi:hypothetical protein PUNSTDRAFT_119077 [Punctularia strigosozonata HHB-11173 SS5]|uniref:uncharacterized protein n=1 Tax=Punctularia strigosozonata (strain HHB-11173) TaxID=741275 RepID=UPI000441777D|nr:uncharacterized protein PUNSTDRAFT_119077 [Punctularia strigosozonata HHB-11173 SS5]EIN11857.1 hypothetical protein PUNSTDRAFT_119077 [Punctularia strigosozonata HHB-11173 SS5]